MHGFLAIFEIKMKIITLILSVFILSISAMTCGDTIASASHNESYNHIENKTHNHSQETKDSCTPFCTCQCCGISITSPILYIFDIIKNIVHTLVLFIILHFIVLIIRMVFGTHRWLVKL